LVPESLRWLIVKGKIQEARQTLQRIANVNGRDVRGDEINLPSYEKEEKSLGDVRVLFSKKYLVSTLVLWYNSLVGAMIYNGLHFTAPNLGGNMYLNWFLSGAGETLGTMMSIYVHTRFGRKKTTAGCEIMAGLASLVSVIIILYDDGSQ
ncbi:solute carrier family 22 member 3, partial [Exaiptasia diaphana]